MVTACLISSAMNWKDQESVSKIVEELPIEFYDAMDGPSEEEAYLQGK